MATIVRHFNGEISIKIDDSVKLTPREAECVKLALNTLDFVLPRDNVPRSFTEWVLCIAKSYDLSEARMNFISLALLKCDSQSTIEKAA
ncbi:MAG: hypothetical protein MK175_20180 [Pseudoalteromonas sp.]|uniref:hypothetical protein n=1 Tax=Pseudoalteromonas sp. TaxID=53249 RepID=UPI0025E827BE|nr:hypothetical protein [Pseudoalteromonas sp.]MCH2089507.1 hypothetical protein [Pseudoalteromonas sp.]